MGLKLKGSRKQIPAGIFFIDPRTGRQFNPYEQGLNETVRQIITHRSTNPTFYPDSEGVWFDPTSVRQEILAVVYTKRPDLFEAMSKEDQIPIFQQVQKNKSTCSGCGAESLEPVYCPTCSGKRITGYKCSNCGKVQKK